MKIRVSAQFSGVISRGSYENSRPGFSAEVEMDLISADGNFQDEIDQMQKRLHGICYDNFKACEDQAIVERINKERADFRWYPCPKCGEQHPSCSSITGWDSDFFVPPHQLQQYASQGNLYDLQAKHYILTGTWPKVEEIEGSWADLVILKKGDLKLTANGWDFPAFLKKYPLEKMQVGKPVISCAHKFGGTPDIREAWYEGKKYLCDVKRSPDKAKHFKQTAGYVIAEEENGATPYDGMMLIPANDETKQGFSKPLITHEIAQYKSMFLKDREAFKKRFSV